MDPSPIGQGAVAQLGEHLPCKQDVEGSSLSSSTNGGNTMVKRLLSLCILLTFICLVLMALQGCRKNVGLDGKPVFRDKESIEAEDIHYFDGEAIALADTSGDTASLRSEALRAFNLVNEIRTDAGLNTLAWDPNLESTSDVRAKECSKQFSHTRPNNQPWYTVNSEIMGGENLAFGYNNAKDVLRGWMDSTAHRENILFPDFTRISMSIYQTDDGTCYWSQEFGY